MSEIVPIFYEPGSSFREWADSRIKEEASLRSQLIAKREILLEQINWDLWDPEQSKRLALLDYLLGI